MTCNNCQECNPCSPTPCVQESCPCAVFLEDTCITTTENMPYTGITKGKTLGEWILALDEYLQDKFTSIENFFKLKNVGLGAEIYKGISILGEKEIRSLTSTDNSVIITEDTNSIDLIVPEVNQNNYVRKVTIQQDDLPENYSDYDVLDYFLALPEIDRTLTETDSKLNVIVEKSGDGYNPAQIFEIHNTGKGIIETLDITDFVKIRDMDNEASNWEEVLTYGSNLTSSHESVLSGEIFSITTSDNDIPSGGYLGIAQTSLAGFPDAFIGRRIGNDDLEKVSLEFNDTSTVFTDSVNNKGMVYNGTYEANFTGKSLITKDYADSLAVAGVTEAKKEYIVIPLSDLTTNLTTGTTKAYFRMPFAAVINSVRASVLVAQTAGSILTFDINESGVSILSTKLTIDNNEKTSLTATTPPVVSDTSLADDAEITFNIDQVGTTGAKGATITLLVTRA